ncbi:MAG: hypothetical protein A2921_04715 [Candidatus Magasanikbacteria bacterium RIFCSPLOWO2_01_FULL_43_20b]|uniref:Uncharacterized protein n=1 Tax=Candidatus Magasanikbacteria bacterium RIFCSPLOWO2_12_FULL_43_12 TaxID=1798692 RepID=A0A1F6MRW5_9BACT|nr:MAG: hypothetical protein A3C74_00445 [Candidatus Magasanikbacteria bacterium RIFCSPHIGHO2_02_FULL_44_13]OGH71772.1 MAG: hypothetical protein A3I93_01715 [Candidatus Magasanikbacteria bacterium RIFCSPLOWO2_02_FULL_43_22]OGH73087.1 MAG: hypothetical protein A2921_04715 [Candidatus Magasanikbacteria bacterium RIFCSPLOWO2_01_FULL_43_20b]OGH74415.1 MAG: hypothetical protein A3G00_00975 [Candidatus Magasanikbacteria bacterium RIFCSPLOWO2_12_FULL_43_12]
MKGELFMYSFLFVIGCIIGCLVSLAYVEDTNRKRNQERLDLVATHLSQCRDSNDDCKQEKRAAQEELRVADHLITQQGLAVMNCLMLRDPLLDSLLLPEPPPTLYSLPAPSP